VPRRKVLICEDEAELRDLMRLSLGDGEYDISEAADGDEAVELARSQHPDVVLLDLMMPGRSGLEVLHELRSDPAFETTKIVMVTARVQPSDREAFAEAGADVFLAKPFSPLHLETLVRDLVQPEA
jgi:CheY-like chemotaxis protein